MTSNKYEFIARWGVTGRTADVYRIIEDVTDFPRWWPAVWLSVDEVEPGDSDGIGRVTRMTSMGWLPYVLQWTSTTVEKVFPESIVLQASGDFDGQGRWSFCDDNDKVCIEYLWQINAKKLMLRYLSFLFRPLFSANHDWAVARGEDSLRLELARRHAATDDERARVPPPPQPVFLGRRQRHPGLQIESREEP